MITDELLLENGYKEWEPNLFHQFAKKMFQKRIRNEIGQTKYFITIYKYEDLDSKTQSYNVDLQFEKDNYTMNILLFAINDKMTIEEIEQEVYAIWYGLDCKYYNWEE